MRNSHLGQEQCGVDGLGAVRAQDGGQDGAGGDVDGDRQLRPAQAAVLEDGHDVQAGGVDLHLLPGPQHHRRDEARAGAVAVRAGRPGRSAGSASTLTSR